MAARPSRLSPRGARSIPWLLGLASLGCDLGASPAEPGTTAPQAVAPDPAEAPGDGRDDADDARDEGGDEDPGDVEATGCTLGEPRTWLADAGPRDTLALHLDAGDGLLAIGARDAVRVARLRDGAVAGEPRAVPLEGARRLFALEALGEGVAVVALGACPESAHCLLARRLDADGHARGEPIAAALPAPLRTARRAAAGNRLYVAWSAEDGHRGLDLFTALGGGLGRARRPLGDAPAEAELPTEILGAAASDEGWVVVWRRGAPEDARSRVFVTTERASPAVEALHEALVIDAIAFDGEHVTLVAGFEFSRPHVLRLTPGATEPGDARTLAADAPVPAPFAERVRAALEVDDEGLWLRRSDAAGDPLGPPVHVAGGPVGAATVARVGDRFEVAWVDPEAGAVRARTVACERRRR